MRQLNKKTKHVRREGGCTIGALLRAVLRTCAVLGTLALLAATTARAGVDDLAWMTGTWVGPMGPDQELEENWTAPRAGSIASLVRARNEDGTSMIELIVVEEQADTLVLHLQQWDPGYSPRPGGPQKFTLASLDERRVRFEASGDGGLRSLTYSRPADDTFTVTVETAEGQTFDLILKRP
jgi:hypothetical protein